MNKGDRHSFSSLVKRTETRTGRPAILSPYIPELLVSCPSPRNRWVTNSPLTGKHGLHSKAVWEHYNGPVPEGYVVHHKSGQHNTLEDDHPDNLMLLTENQNSRLFPALALELGIPESIITDCFIEADGDIKQFLYILSQL